MIEVTSSFDRCIEESTLATAGDAEKKVHAWLI